MYLLTRYSRHILIGAILLLITACTGLVVYKLISKNESKPTPPTLSSAQIVAERAVARVYIKDLHTYSDIISNDTQFDIENELYAYAYFIGKNDLYTGTIRKGSYALHQADDGSYSARMLVDVDPIDVTYNISIKKDTKRKYPYSREIFIITCASQPDQINNSSTCVDERGR